jgi:hypothetical protein
MPNPNPFLRPALDAMLRAARARREASAHPFLARENVGLRGGDFPGPSAMPTMPRPSVLTREQEFQAGRVRLPGALEPGIPPGGFLRPINPPEIAGGMEIPRTPLGVGEARELPAGFKITYTQTPETILGAKTSLHLFDILGPAGDTRQIRIRESVGRPGVGLTSIKYTDPNRPDAQLLHASGQPQVPIEVVRAVIAEIRDALPNIHTVLGGRTGGAHESSALARMRAGENLPSVLQGNTQQIRLRRPFLDQ